MFRNPSTQPFAGTEEKEEIKRFSNSDPLFWNWLWRLLDQLTNQPNLLKGVQMSKWAIGGSFAIFWWECLFDIESVEKSWDDIDIYLNYGDLLVPGEKMWSGPENVDLKLTQNIAMEILTYCGGKLLAPEWAVEWATEDYVTEPIKDRKRLTNPLELYVDLKNHRFPFKLDLSFKDKSFFQPINKSLYYFQLEGLFGTSLLVPVFSIQTLLNIYTKERRWGKADADIRKIVRLEKLKEIWTERKFKLSVINPALQIPPSRCFRCNQRNEDKKGV